MIKLLAIALMVSVLAAGCTAQATGNVISETSTTASTIATTTSSTIPATTTSPTTTIATTTTINGTTTLFTTTTKPKPDLSVDIVEFQDGNRKPLMYVINSGDVEALGVRLRVDYSMPNNASAKYACFYPGPTGSFNVEVGKIYQASCNVSAKIPGSYEVIAFVDPDNKIAEKDEANNKFTTIVRVS